MKQAQNNRAASPDAAIMTDDQLHEGIMRLINEGKLVIEIDDSDIRKSVDTVGKASMESYQRLHKAIGETLNGLKLVGDEAAKAANAEEVTRALDELRASVAHLAKREAKVTYDEAKLKVIADEVAQSILTDKVAQSIAEGSVQPLPPLLKVDPFFVENDQTSRIELCLDTRRHAMVSGPSGSGKTFPVEQILRKRALRYLAVSVADGLTMSDFLARANVRATDKGSETYYTYGFLPFTMINGLPLLLDEIDQCQPEIVSILNKALESRTLYIPQTGETITASPNWQVFMTCNTLRDSTDNYSGFRLNAALLNRVVFIKADYLPAKDEKAIFERVGLLPKDASILVGLLQGLRAAYDGGKLTQAPSTRIGVRVARCLLGQDDDGKKAATPMKLSDAFAFCLVDGLPTTEVKEALAVLRNGV